MFQTTTLFIILLGISLFNSTDLLAQKETRKNKNDLEMNREQRLIHADFIGKEAESHRKVAECFRSNRSIKDCLEEHKINCPLAKDNHCYLLDEHEDSSNDLQQRHHHRTPYEFE